MRPHEPDSSPLLWTSTCCRHEIHIALLKQLVQWPSWPKVDIWLYDCNLFKTVLLVIYNYNLYCWKCPLFVPSKDEILMKRRQPSLHEKKTGWRQWTLILIFSVDVHMGLDPSPRPHASIWAWPPPCIRHKWMAPNGIGSLSIIIFYPDISILSTQYSLDFQ